MTVTLKELRNSAQMDDSAFQSALATRNAMTTSPRREDETMEGYTIRLIREEERERCAKIAEKWSGGIDDDGSLVPAPEGIAAAIRKQE